MNKCKELRDVLKTFITNCEELNPSFDCSDKDNKNCGGKEEEFIDVEHSNRPRVHINSLRPPLVLL